MPSPRPDDCSHDVRASRDGAHAVLECGVCKARQRIGDGEFQAMNAFVDRHRACCS